MGLCAVAALYCTGFAESITDTLGWENPWAVRGTAAVTLIVLVGINLAGVKWVIRLQLLLLLVLVISTSDFIIGTGITKDFDAGVVGYSAEVLSNNSYQSYTPGEDFFSVFGVFFPTATGVMAGVNMSGDLKTPRKSIPLGTLSAIFLTFILYLLFVLLLGSTCLRSALQEDFMIAEKVSAVSFLWLAGLYMSSTSSCSTGLYGAPRVLQSIADQNVVPFIKCFGKGFGPNKTPVIAICFVALLALVFILIGNLNVISPMITCNFMLVYAVVDYAHFALMMDCEMDISNKDKDSDVIEMDVSSRHSSQNGYSDPRQDLFRVKSDENLSIPAEAPESTENTQINPANTNKDAEKSLYETFNLAQESEDHDSSLMKEDNDCSDVDITQESSALPEVTTVEVQPTASDANNFENAAYNSMDDRQSVDSNRPKDNEERLTDFKPGSEWYTVLCNRWLSLFGVLLSLVVMFLINWMYSLINILIFTILLLYISQAGRNLRPGVASNFSFKDWIVGLFKSLKKGGSTTKQERVSLVHGSIVMNTVPEQLTSDNEDYAGRSRYHHVQTENHSYTSVMPMSPAVP